MYILYAEEREHLLSYDDLGNIISRPLSEAKESVIVAQTTHPEFANLQPNTGLANTARGNALLQPTTARETVYVHSTGDIHSTPGGGIRGRTDNRVSVPTRNDIGVPGGGSMSVGHQPQRFVNNRRRARGSDELDRVSTSFTSLTDNYRGIPRNVFSRTLNQNTEARRLQHALSSAGILQIPDILPDATPATTPAATPATPPVTITATTPATTPPVIHVMVPQAAGNHSQTVSYGTAMAQLHGIRPAIPATSWGVTEAIPSSVHSVAIAPSSLRSGNVTRDPRTSYDPNIGHIYRRHSPCERISEGRKRRPLGGTENSRNGGVASATSTSTNAAGHAHDDVNNNIVANVTRLPVSRDGRSLDGRSREGRGHEVRVQDGRGQEGRSNEGRGQDGRNREGRGLQVNVRNVHSEEGRVREGRGNAEEVRIPIVESLIRANRMDRRITEITQIRDFIRREIAFHPDNEEDSDLDSV